MAASLFHRFPDRTHEEMIHLYQLGSLGESAELLSGNLNP